MKYLKNLFSFIVMLAVLTLTSCDRDQKGPTYNSENVGLSFTFDSFEMSAPATDPVITVPVYRANVNGDFSTTVEVEVTDKDGKPVTGVSADTNLAFKDGENEAHVNVNLGDELAIGQAVTITIALNESEVSVGGIAVAETVAYKEYTFKTIGTGKFVDNFATGVAYEVEIQKAEGYPRYRVMDPYTQTMKNDDGGNGDWVSLTTCCPYIEFWEVGNGLVNFKPFSIGLNYDANAAQGIIAHHPSDFEGEPVSFNKKLSDKLYQLAPYYFVDALGGGFPMHKQDGVILIELP